MHLSAKSRQLRCFITVAFPAVRQHKYAARPGTDLYKNLRRQQQNAEEMRPNEPTGRAGFGTFSTSLQQTAEI